MAVVEDERQSETVGALEERVLICRSKAYFVK